MKDKNIRSHILSMRVMDSCFALINYHEIEISGSLSNFSVCRDLSSELLIRKLYVHLVIGRWCSKIVVAFSSSWSRWTGLYFYSFLWNFHLNLLSLKSDEKRTFPYKIKERRNFPTKSTKILQNPPEMIPYKTIICHSIVTEQTTLYIFHTANKYFPVINPKLYHDNGKNTSTPVTLCNYYKVDQTIYLNIHNSELDLHLSLHPSASYPDPFWKNTE